MAGVSYLALRLARLCGFEVVSGNDLVTTQRLSVGEHDPPGTSSSTASAPMRVIGVNVLLKIGILVAVVRGSRGDYGL
ncbi:hypothetical protein, partial [Actinomyces sp. Z3]|uniref:hypothetical protein n=1 Tax=Actinomyces sp. Z3 TaxID=2250217 RepID=UPI001C65C4F8